MKSSVYKYDVVLTGNINGNTIFRSMAAVLFDFVAKKRVDFAMKHTCTFGLLLFYLILLLKGELTVFAMKHTCTFGLLWRTGVVHLLC